MYSYRLLLLCYAFLFIPNCLYAQNKSKSDDLNVWIELKEADIIPLSLGKHERKIHAYIREKSWKKAARLIEDLGDAQRYLKAWLYNKAEAWDEVLLHVNGLETHPILKDQASYLKAQAAESLSQHQVAIDATEQITQVDQALWRETLRVRALALRGVKRWNDAQKVYQQLLESPRDEQRGVARLGLAMIALEQGLLEDAIRLFKAVDIQHPKHWTSQLAYKEANKLIKSNKEWKGSWSDRSLAEKITRLEHLQKRHHYQNAIQLAQSLLKRELSADLKCRVLYLLGKSQDRLRKRSEALRSLSRASEVCHSIKHENTPLALYIAGRTAARLDKDDLSDTFFLRLFENYQHRLSDDAAVFLIRHILRKKNGLKKAMEINRLLPELHTDGDLSSEALMFTFVEAFKQKKWILAQELVDLSKKLTPKDFRFHDAGRFIYWQGRLDLIHKRKSKAIKAFQTVLSTAPLSWYSLMAYSRLYEINRDLAINSVTEALSWQTRGLSLPSGNQVAWQWKFLQSDPHWSLMQRALMWMRLGLEKEGVRAFKALSSDNQRPDLQWFSAWALDGYAIHHHSHDILRRKLTEYRNFPPYGYVKKHWLIAYPIPFRKEVIAAAEAEEVDPNFIWGVMREESGYSRLIRSSANAVGLLQLILPTAKMMRKKTEPEVSVESLGNPKFNIMLGARYLQWVKEHIKCSWTLVPAGYNAGGGALKRWLKLRGDLPLDLFVETIPYEEARWYLKRVNASWITFRTLYGVPKGQDLWPYISLKTYNIK
jgi:soluble lytic murein transglycosylase